MKKRMKLCRIITRKFHLEEKLQLPIHRNSSVGCQTIRGQRPLLKNRVTRGKCTERSTRGGKAQSLTLAVYPQRAASEFKNLHMYSCLPIRQKITEKEKQSGGNSELKIDYQRANYHNKW